MANIQVNFLSYTLHRAVDLTVIIPGREYVARGSARLDDINEELHLDLTSEDYDSIGGYIIEQLDSLPGIGQSVSLPGGARLVVDDLSNNRIRTVHIWLPEETDASTSKEKTAE